jgi:hypothetical protein
VADPSYSPRLRTGLILCGTGTAGAYQAGVVRALGEAGVKIDVVAAHGPGVMTALCAGIDGGAQLADPAGPWTDARLQRAYRWRGALRAAAYGLMGAILILLSPLLVMLIAGALYAASVVTALASMSSTAERLVAAYRAMLEWLFDPPVLPTIMPRALVLALLVVVAVLVVAAVRAARHERSRRRLRGAFWWRLIGQPLDAHEPGALMIDALWRLVRGASHEPRPAKAELGRRYVDMLADNFGQPGFREVVVAVHDLDARRDLVGAVLPAAARGAFENRRPGGALREAEVLDLTGPARDHVVDFVLAALRLPIATDPLLVTLSPDGHWRGETHRWCDRPELAVRLIDELAIVGVEQVVIVSPAARPAVPHGMRSRPVDLRGRMGELVRSVETAALDDAVAASVGRFAGVFVVRPDHNAIGPFDFGGVYDESSDRRRTLGELIAAGYEDAYREFIEPVVATGETVDI